MKRFTIKQRLLTLFLIMAVVPCFFIGIAAPSYMRNHEINQTEKYMKSLTDSYAKTLDITWMSLTGCHCWHRSMMMY